jgi:tryptophanyl-tRNA synthetase
MIYAIFNDTTIEYAVDRFNGSGYGDLKKATAEVVIEKLAIFQEKYNEIMRMGIANEVLNRGRDYSIEIARKKYNIIRKVVGLGRI